MRPLACAVAIGLVGLVFVACGSKRPPVLNDGNPTVEDDNNSLPYSGVPVGFLSEGDDPATCDDAAAQRSYVGCDYWPTVVANNVWRDFDFAVVVANAGTEPADITITGPSGTNQTGTVMPNQLAKFYLPWQFDLKGPDADSCGTAAPIVSSVYAKAGAYHLQSKRPVTVYQFNALEYAGKGGPPGKDWSTCPGNSKCDDGGPMSGLALGCYSFSNDASLLLPSTAMTGNYRVAGYPGDTSTMGPFMGSYFAITATANQTHVNVALSGTARVVAGGIIQAAAPGGKISFTLDQGDVAEVVGTLGSDVDLSGSLVSADQPVQVITGVPCIEIPSGTLACDHIEESVFPAETLGKQYVIAAPAGPNGNTVGQVVRFYGNADGTMLTYSPSRPVKCPEMLDAGQVVDCGQIVDDLVVTGTHEFAVATFQLGGTLVDPNGGRGDPTESFPVSVEQYRTKYVFLAPDDYDVSYIDIVTPADTMVGIDGFLVDAGLRRDVGNGWGVSRVKLVKGNAAGAHLLTATAPVGLQVMGYGLFTSYQYPGGLELKQIAPPPTLR
jgi:hypothetical protein